MITIKGQIKGETIKDGETIQETWVNGKLISRTKTKAKES
jgi:hypothetical protein